MYINYNQFIKSHLIWTQNECDILKVDLAKVSDVDVKVFRYLLLKRVGVNCSEQTVVIENFKNLIIMNLKSKFVAICVI